MHGDKKQCMLNNKLDPDITENPEKLVVYGGMDVLDIVHNPAPHAADPGGCTPK
ncbi:hypothetical protein [Alteribacillus bidgolensis]|uniref:hypothetical protein n=1 Tax=Alteribacillus bidgolensis TaxID=930129 RepID=UPI0024826E24|nr:hypothetical protein [Alteribacillus bidgolensis]